MRNREQQKKPNWLSAAVFLLLFAPQFFVPVVFLGGVGYLIYGMVKNSKTAGEKPACTAPRSNPDDCPRPLFCFHKDKGEHHVRKGKEVDPWDRPDIDISKYQRRK